jgi:hypothetical protein
VIVHLLDYRVVPGHEAEVLGYLRHTALAEPPNEGLIARYVGGRLSQQVREQIAATVWQDGSSLARGTDEKGIPAFLSPEQSVLGDRTARQYRVIASTGIGREGAHVLRVYRTSIAPEAVEEWEKRTTESTGQMASKGGLLTVIAGVEMDTGAALSDPGEVCVAVLTAWNEWDLLLRATGGRLNRGLIDTELVDIERPATADHYEILEAEMGPG